MNEICAKLAVDAEGKVVSLINQMSCDPQIVKKALIEWDYTWAAVIFVAVVVAWFIFLYPKWNVWSSKKRGEAQLQEAMNEQRIQIAKATARKEAAEHNKAAAIIEASAVSEQIKQIGSQLTTHDLYLKWQWIKMMEERPDSSVIYVPTEASLPILEAGNRKEKPSNKKEE